MTEDILFDNLYVGHSVEDAKKLAAETFEIKKPLESKADKPADADEDDEELSFKEDPVGFIRSKVLNFVDHVKEDPVDAFKSQPETGAALAAALFTIFGMLGAFLGLIGGSQKPVVTKVSCDGWKISILLTDFPFSLPRRPMLPLLMTRQRLKPPLLQLPVMTRRMTTASRSGNKLWI